MAKRFSLLILVLLILGLVVIVVTKNGPLRPSSEPDTTTKYEVAPRFREFYFEKGGESVLGYVISPLFYDREGNEYQYTTKVLMVYNPSKDESNRFGFGPIGLDLDIQNQLTLSQNVDKAYSVYPAFEHLHKKLGGEAYVGKPISPALFDYENKRIVQYFENVGFFIDESKATDNVGLLYYGLWKCAKACGGTAEDSMAIINLSVGRNYLLERFAQALTEDITGKKLSEPIITDNGEVIGFYVNLAIYSKIDDPQSVNILPLPLLLGVQRDIPERKTDLQITDEYIFYSQEGEIGYKIFKPLLEYFSRYGGIAFTGAPITHPEKLPGSERYRQCFEHICVTYSTESPPMVSLEPLGYTYYNKFYNSESTVFLPLVFHNANAEELTLLSNITVTDNDRGSALQIYHWPTYPLIRSDQHQVIGFYLYKAEQPQRGVNMILSVWLPDGKVEEIKLPPTNRDGRTYYKLDPILAPNGTRIIYEVCTDSSEEEQKPVCSKGDYIIWGN